MRRLLAIAFLAALPAAAQIYGVPASVTSITPSRSTPGVPASVTSLGPYGYVDPMFRPSVDPMFRRPPVDPMFRNPAYGNPCGGRSCVGGGFHRPHHGRRYAFPAYVPYYVPYYSQPVAADESDSAEAEAEEPPAPTIYERRSRIAYSTGSSDEDRYGEHYTDYREDERRRARAEAGEARKAEVERQQDQRAQEERSRSAEKPADQEPVTVLVFKDGHHQDLHGYAITGDAIYDLGQGRARKIQLADLDLAATTKLNDELGNDFRLPSLPPKQN